MSFEYDEQSNRKKYVCPCCGNDECEIAYFRDDERIGCDRCMNHVYVEDMDDEPEYPEDDDDKIHGLY